jgi:hypothetical protein
MRVCVRNVSLSVFHWRARLDSKKREWQESVSMVRDSGREYLLQWRVSRRRECISIARGFGAMFEQRECCVCVES